MKTTVLFSFMVMGFGALAQERTSISRSIHDDGKKLEIKIDVERKSGNSHYERTFNAEGMSKEEKRALIEHIQDSLGVYVMVAPRPPKPMESRSIYSDKTAVVVGTNEDGVRVSSDSEKQRNSGDGALVKNTIIASDGTSYTKLLEEDKGSGRLKMRYEYSRNGDSHVYERTINTAGKSEREIKRIIEETERNLGF